MCASMSVETNALFMHLAPNIFSLFPSRVYFDMYFWFPCLLLGFLLSIYLYVNLFSILRHLRHYGSTYSRLIGGHGRALKTSQFISNGSAVLLKSSL